MKTTLTGAALCAALAAPTLASAAFFDFQGWTAANGEQGFANSSPFSMTVDSLTLTATAFEDSTGAASHVYMDDAWHGIIGGMGVCTSLDTASQCHPSSDDNVSDDEILSWEFDRNITAVTLEMGDDEHYAFAGSDFLYRYGSMSWNTVTTDASGVIDLLLDGSASRIDFKTVAADRGANFYIRNAEVSAVPVPAAVWLFGSGLLGLTGVARRRAG